MGIFQSEFLRVMGADAFFVPESLAEDLRFGNTRLFNKQRTRFAKLSGKTPSLQACIDMILDCQKGLSQEFYLLDRH